MKHGTRVSSSEAASVQRSDQSPEATAQSLRALAHELNSLLDGSLRTLRLTRRAMLLGEPTPETIAATRDLDNVEAVMVRMADALARVLATPAPPTTAQVVSAFTDPRPLQQTALAVVRNIAALAEELNVSVRLECDAQAAELSTGPLEPLLRNAIQNAVEACGRSVEPGVPATVHVSLRRRGDRLLIDVLDNGPGIERSHEPHGHGVGLSVTREVVDALGGSFELSNVPFGRGAVLRASIPIAASMRARAA